MLLGLGEHGEDARAGAGDVLPFLRAGDVVILGGGIWYRAGSVEKEAGVAATITPEVTAAARRRGVALLWMETSAQHFPSADGFGGRALQPVRLHVLRHVGEYDLLLLFFFAATVV